MISVPIQSITKSGVSREEVFWGDQFGFRFNLLKLAPPYPCHQLRKCLSLQIRSSQSTQHPLPAQDLKWSVWLQIWKTQFNHSSPEWWLVLQQHEVVPWNSHIRNRNITEQECIPVECVPSTAVAVSGGGGESARGVSAGGVSAGGCLPRGVSAWGVGVCPGRGCLSGGRGGGCVCLGEGVCLPRGVYTSPPCEQNYRQV